MTLQEMTYSEASFSLFVFIYNFYRNYSNQFQSKSSNEKRLLGQRLASPMCLILTLLILRVNIFLKKHQVNSPKKKRCGDIICFWRLSVFHPVCRKRLVKLPRQSARCGLSRWTQSHKPDLTTGQPGMQQSPDPTWTSSKGGFVQVGRAVP